MGLIDLLIVVSIILLVVLFTWLALGLLTLIWQRRCNQRLTQIAWVLEAIRERILHAERATAQFPSNDPEPYGSTAGELHLVLAQVRWNLTTLTEQLANLPAATFPESDNLLVGFLNGFGPRPRFQKHRYSNAEALWQSAQSLETQTDHIEELLSKLQNMPLHAARRSRALLNTTQTTLAVVQALLEAGFREPELVPTIQNLELLEARLRQLPSYFLSGTDHQVMREASKESVINTWRTLNDLEVLAGPHFQKAQRWLSAYQELDRYINRNADLLNQITADMDEAAKTAEYPIEWQRSQRELERLRYLEAKIGKMEAKRGADELDEDLAQAKRLARQCEALAGQVAEARNWRDRLVPLLKRPDIVTAQSWAEWAGDLHKTVNAYNLRNWGLGNRVDRIAHDTKQLAKRHKNLVSSYVNRPLPETALNKRLMDDVQRLVADLEKLQKWLQRVATALEALQQQEQKAHETLTTHLESLEHMIGRIEFAGAQHILHELHAEGHKLRALLQKQHSGLVSKKAKRVDKWAKKVQAFSK